MRSITRRRFLPAATALTMALTGWAGVSAASADPSVAAPASAPTGKSYDLTLVTGDVSTGTTSGPSSPARAR